MDSVSNGCSYGVLAFLKDHEEVALGLGVVHSHRKLVEELGDALLVDVFESAIKHEVD